ncbi:MAG: DNA polymerase III subunit delta [Pseudomonadota bacterium]
MGRDLTPEEVMKSLEKGHLAPFYLFYGLGEFRLEKALDKIRRTLIPESVRDFNLEIFYGEKKTEPLEIIERARSIPFMAGNRLLIIRRTDSLSASQLEKFLPYLENPVKSTCLIFISSKTDFKRKFYKKFRDSSRAVHFAELRDSEVAPWLRRAARDLGLKIDGKACVYLHQIVGNRGRDLYGELEKLYLRYGEGSVGLEEVKETAIHSRIYTIFELMDALSVKNPDQSLSILNRYLGEEDAKNASLGIIGMLNRQLRLLLRIKEILDKGGTTKDAARILGPARFSVDNFIKYSKSWSVEELERGFRLLYEADGLLKSGSRPKPILENLILTLCG